MKKLLFALCLLVLCACGKKKAVLLPEIQNAKITEIKDVSPAYLFYDETKPDSLDLNRANLIISTNWLVNVDKRLTLKQVIPAIKKLQDKKRNSSHKNENARNYYTCNDTSIKNLGFIDFTDVVYRGGDEDVELENDYDIYHLIVDKEKQIQIVDSNKKIIETDFKNVTEVLQDLSEKEELQNMLTLSFIKNISFQDYITIKALLLSAEIDNLKISNSEFISD